LSKPQNPGISKSFFFHDSLTSASFTWTLRMRTPMRRQIDVWDGSDASNSWVSEAWFTSFRLGLNRSLQWTVRPV
jgi:hypothetical protein